MTKDVPEWRLFVACELPEDMLKALRTVQEDLRARIPARLRWVRSEGIHLTLKFLGGVQAGRVESIKGALAGAILPFEIRLTVADVGTFGRRSPSVLWAGLEGDVEELAALARKVDQALAALGFEMERRPFTAHLTLARAPDRASDDERDGIIKATERYELPHLPAMTLRRVGLIRSILNPDGARYQTVATFPGYEGAPA